MLILWCDDILLENVLKVQFDFNVITQKHQQEESGAEGLCRLSSRMNQMSTPPNPAQSWRCLTWAWVLPSLQRCRRCSWTVEVDVEPLGIAPMPHAGLFRLAGARPPLSVDVLRQANVGDAGGVLTNQMHVGVEDGGVHGFAVFTQNCDNTKEQTRWIHFNMYAGLFKQ